MPSSQGIKKVLSQASKSTAAASNSQKSIPKPVEESPERKLNLYQMFIQKSTTEFQTKHPDATPAELRKLKNQHWATLSADQKAKWAQPGTESTFGNDLIQSKLTPPSFGNTDKTLNQSGKQPSKSKSSSKPKKVSGYNIFFRQTAAKIRNEQASLSAAEVSKVVAETWGLVSDDVKKKYENMAAQENNHKADNDETNSENWSWFLDRKYENKFENC